MSSGRRSRTCKFPFQQPAEPADIYNQLQCARSFHSPVHRTISSAHPNACGLQPLTTHKTRTQLQAACKDLQLQQLSVEETDPNDSTVGHCLNIVTDSLACVQGYISMHMSRDITLHHTSDSSLMCSNKRKPSTAAERTPWTSVAEADKLLRGA